MVFKSCNAETITMTPLVQRFLQWWRQFVINSREHMRSFSGSLTELHADSLRPEQQGRHARIHEARLSRLVHLERVYTRGYLNEEIEQGIRHLLAVSFDGAEELEEEFSTEIAVFRQAQNNLRLFSRVLDDLSQVLNPAGQDPDFLNPARIWPTVVSSAEALDQVTS